MNRPRRQKPGQIYTPVIVGFLIVMAVAVLVKVIAKKFFEQDRAYSTSVQELRENAPLVIVGRLSNIRDEITHTSTGYTREAGVKYYDIAVESVERGEYPKDAISVAVGWFSNYDPPDVYPPGVRKSYDVGERLRVFINQNESGGYYTSGLWTTIELVKDSVDE